VGGSTTTTVFEELGSGDYDAAAWASFNTSLDAYAGQTIYLLMETADGGGGAWSKPPLTTCLSRRISACGRRWLDPVTNADEERGGVILPTPFLVQILRCWPKGVLSVTVIALTPCAGCCFFAIAVPNVGPF
jgi:hypothetical protein